MLQFKLWLELFDAAQPTQVQPKPNGMRATFQAGSTPYFMHTSKFPVHFMDYSRPPGVGFVISFGIDNPGASDDAAFGVTGSGNASMVLGTVLKQINSLTTANPQAVIVFSSKQASRTSLYRRMVSRMASSRRVYERPSKEAGDVFILSPYDLHPEEVDEVAENA